MNPLFKDIKLPAIKKVILEIIEPFDYKLIKNALKHKKWDFIDTLIWPEAIKSMYKNVENTENKLLHLRSCCDKALNENIRPFKSYLWNKIIKYL